MTEINKDQITIVRQYNKQWCKYYKHHTQKEKKFLGFIITKECSYWRDCLSDEYNLSYILKSEPNVYEENNKLFFLPHLDISLSDKQTVTKYFSDLEELTKWREKNLKGVNLIEI